MSSTLIFAQAAGSSSSGAAMAMQIAPRVLLFVVFYFLLIRPQQKRMKEHQAKVESAKRGDTVVTGGGIVGKVIKTDEVYAEVEIATGVKVKVVKATLTDVVDASAKPAND
jgi:preprotein translocase subunit YajC